MRIGSRELDIFDGHREFTFLAGPLLVILCYVILNQFVLGPGNGDGHRPLFTWISAAIFANSVHALFSLKNSLLMPEYYNLFNRVGFTRIRQLALLVGLYALFFYGFQHTTAEGHYKLSKYFLFLIFLGSGPHAWRQTLGLSLLYNRKKLDVGSKIMSKEDLIKAEIKARNIEHRANQLIIVGITLHAINRILLPQDYHAASSALSNLGKIAFLIGGALYLRVLTLIPERDFLVKKATYLARLLPIVLIPSVVFRTYYSASNHGFESLLVEDRVTRRSVGGKKLLIYGTIVSIVGALIKLQCESTSHFFGFPPLNAVLPQNFVNYYMEPLGFTLGFFHYISDFFIYRMKNPANRELIAPLLIDPRRTEAQPAPLLQAS